MAWRKASMSHVSTHIHSQRYSFLPYYSNFCLHNYQKTFFFPSPLATYEPAYRHARGRTWTTSTRPRLFFRTKENLTANERFWPPAWKGTLGLREKTLILQLETATPRQQMRASKVLIKSIRRFENFRSKAYQDAKGVWTIGYGHTVKVKEGDAVTRKEAEKLLRDDLKTCEDYVNSLGV